MADVLATGRAAWPAIELAADVLARYLADRGLAPDADHGADLFLACACTTRVPAALAAFDATYAPQLPTYLARLRLTREQIDEVGQALRERLFVGDAPKIADYGGKGPLGAWLRVIAVRVAIDRQRAAAPPMRELAHDGLVAAATSPELELLRARYRDHFRGAFAAALAARSSEQRTLLRLHYLDGVSMDELGRMFGVNRSTIFRRLQSCQQALLDDLRDRLREELGVSTEELHSLAAALRSDLELSLGDHLKSVG